MASLSEPSALSGGRRRGASTIVDRLLAAPAIHPRDLGLTQEDRAAARHVFQRRVFE